MTRFRWVAGVTAAFIMAAAVQAGPMGPVQPQVGRFALEFEAASEMRRTEWSPNVNDKRKAESILYLGRGSYGLTDRVEVYARLGAANLKVKDVSDIGPNGPFTTLGATINGKSKLAWGLGLSGILYDAGTWNLAATANYFSHNGHDAKAPDNNSDYDYWDYNLGLQLQGKFNQFLPYLGVKYSNSRVDYSKVRGAGVTYKDDQERNIGVYGGAAVHFTPQWSAYLEGRFVDETSFGGGIRYLF